MPTEYLDSNGLDTLWQQIRAADNVVCNSDHTIHEYYKLPTFTASADTNYDILTSKSAVTIAQGGTGATSASAARTNLGLGTMATEAASDYLPISGKAVGIKTSNTAGYETDTLGYFQHQRTTNTDTWAIKTNSGTSSFYVNYETGSATSIGTITASLLKTYDSGGYPGVAFATSAAAGVYGVINFDSVTNHRFYFIQRYTAGATYAERYVFPAATTTMSEDVWYQILTNKNAVTVAQGGTGATTAANARTNLGLGSIATASTSDYIPTANYTGNYKIYSNSNEITSLYILNSSGSSRTNIFTYTNSNTTNQLRFREWTNGTSYWEQYALPEPTASSSASGQTYSILTSKSAVTIAQGGTGQTTRAAAIDAFMNLGTTPISTTTNDTPAKWKDYNTGVAWYNATGKLNDQPSQYGLLLNLRTAASNNDVHQLWFAQANGDLWHRGGNASGWGGGSGTWKKILDTSNYTATVTPANIGAATSGHNHNGTYVKVSGDTMTGMITHKNSAASTSSFKIFAAQSSDDTVNRAAIWTEADHAISFAETLKGASVSEVFILPTPTSGSSSRYNILTSKETWIITRNLAGGSSTTVNIGSEALIVIVRRPTYGVYVADYWQSNVLQILPTGSGFSNAPTFTKSANSNSLTIANTNGLGQIGVIVIGCKVAFD